MKLIVVAFAVLVGSCPTWAQDGRFIEFSAPHGKTQTYDLSTVQMIQPGRFTIITTSIATPDVMKFELKVLGILRTYCSPDGEYPAPADAFALGSPDMEVKSIRVISNPKQLSGKTHRFTTVVWSYPYLRLAAEFQGKMYPADNHMFCEDDEDLRKTETEMYLERRSEITNGERSKELFDCKRGLTGNFRNEDDDPAKADTSYITPDSWVEKYYLGVCSRVTKEKPYDPN
jgi:hypothetical protein